ncbi:MAG: hypothetical protein II749_00080 [Clostridia bacterium]|nr:hypothetical protein [Clostridia bacterium]
MKKKFLLIMVALIIAVIPLTSCKKKSEIHLVVYRQNDVLRERFGVDKLRTDAEEIDSFYMLQSKLMFDENAIGYIAFDELKKTKEIFGVGEDDHKAFYIARQEDLPLDSMTLNLYGFIIGAKGQEIAKSLGYNQTIEMPLGFCGSCYKPVDPEKLTIYTDEKSYDLVSVLVEAYHGYNKDGQFEVVKVDDPLKYKPDAHTIICLYTDKLELEGAKTDRFADNRELRIVVSPDRDINSISIEKMRDILTGKIKYWEDI